MEKQFKNVNVLNQCCYKNGVMGLHQKYEGMTAQRDDIRTEITQCAPFVQFVYVYRSLYKQVFSCEPKGPCVLSRFIGYTPISHNIKTTSLNQFFSFLKTL